MSQEYSEELEKRMACIRDTDQLVKIVREALLLALKDNQELFQQLSQPLYNELLYDKQSNEDPLCQSFLDLYSCSLLSEDDFIDRYDDLNVPIFRRHLNKCSIKYIEDEILLECEEKLNSSTTVPSFISADLEKEIVLNLMPFVMKDDVNSNDFFNIIDFLTIKLAEEQNVRIATEESYIKLKCRMDDICGKYDHLQSEVIKLTKIKEVTRKIPSGKWLPEKSNSEDPSEEDLFWGKKKVIDKRHLKWFVSERLAYESARDIDKKFTFSNLLFDVFGQTRIESYRYPSDFPEAMGLACQELLEWLSKLRKSILKLQKIDTSSAAELRILKIKLKRFYDNKRDQEKKMKKNNGPNGDMKSQKQLSNASHEKSTPKKRPRSIPIKSKLKANKSSAKLSRSKAPNRENSDSETDRNGRMTVDEESDSDKMSDSD